MNLWALPGPARFVRHAEDALRDGANVVVRFPAATPSGFGEHFRSRLQESWRCTLFHPAPTSSPFRSIRERFAPNLPNEWNPTLLDLCEHADFRGRLVWLDGVARLDTEDCFAWKKFLVDYAQASRSVPEFERTLFIAVLEGAPPADPPPEDVTLKCFDWRGVVDETDLLLAAHERLHSRDAGPVMRSLLATSVAHVASWDPDVAERLLDAGSDAILDPLSLLQSVAKEKGWTSETDACWELGTASGNGVSHAALASLEDPPRDLRRRLWSAQASVLLPSIAGWRVGSSAAASSADRRAPEARGQTRGPVGPRHRRTHRHGAASGFRPRGSTGRAADEPVAKRTRTPEALVGERRKIVGRPVGDVVRGIATSIRTRVSGSAGSASQGSGRRGTTSTPATSIYMDMAGTAGVAQAAGCLQV